MPRNSRTSDSISRPFKHVEKRLAGPRLPKTTDFDSERMGRVRREGTQPEAIVRRTAWRLGLRLRRPARRLPGSPDLANLGRGLAVFIHGCFWHGHRGCVRATVPKRNRPFWIAKFERNRARDRKVVRELRDLGFRVVTIWECEAEDMKKLTRQLLGVTSS
mgnify:CR=1 FL=1